jgi:2-polyprenyl-3-methyl-5-hydroxy-6-metoxy-1,4-benzoquinol methylase
VVESRETAEARAAPPTVGRVSGGAELHESTDRYYTAYYRDTLGIPDWSVLVQLRRQEETQERGRLARLEALLGAGALRGRVLNVGCGTGGFNAAAAAAGARVVGVDADADAIAICALRRGAGLGFTRAAGEALPFSAGAFDLVHCFSVIEHVASVTATIGEMVRVTRRGGAIYVHTPNAWSFYEGHYKLFWTPFLPKALGRAYLKLRGRPVAYLATLRRLTRGAIVRAFAAAGVTDLTFYDDDRPRETLGRLRVLTGAYYRWSGVTPYLELVARKP